jgi:hypothetical protein
MRGMAQKMYLEACMNMNAKVIPPARRLREGLQ